MKTSTRKQRLNVESLEARDVPAVLFDGATATIRIDGTTAGDAVRVNATLMPIALNVYLEVVVVTFNGVQNQFVNGTQNDPFVRGVPGAVQRIAFSGNAGDDTFTNQTVIPATAYGDAGNDVLRGGANADLLDGRDGNDTIYGDAGNDTLNGGVGNDYLIGEDGNDVLIGWEGNDNLDGQSGNDTLTGWTGNDTLNGGVGDDSANGEAGNDVLIGWEGNDNLDGQDGYDTLTGWTGNDTLNGGVGNDAIYGEAGNDLLYGWEGDDLILGGDGNDVAYGYTGNDTIDGQGGNDSLYGEQNDDVLKGGSGRDYLNASSGNDVLFGGAYADVDTMYGGSGTDRFLVIRSEDLVNDWTPIDARVYFSTDGGRFWTNAEIERIDEGLAWLQKLTGNTKLLKQSNGNEMVFQRVQSLAQTGQGETVAADNDSRGQIRFCDAGLAADQAVAQIVIHELGHNWDKESVYWGEWLGQSGWNSRGIFQPATGDEVSWDGDWTYRYGTEFARNYSRTNPMEDWSTAWEVYYNYRLNPASAFAQADYTRMSAKMAILQRFFNSQSN